LGSLKKWERTKKKSCRQTRGKGEKHRGKSSEEWGKKGAFTVYKGGKMIIGVTGGG